MILTTEKEKHWTDEDENFRFSMASGVILQIGDRVHELGLSTATFAKKLGITEEEVNHFISNPRELALDTMTKWVRALGMKLSIVVYDDSDAEGVHGPVHPQIFRKCWEAMGKPRDSWELQDVVLRKELKE